MVRRPVFSGLGTRLYYSQAHDSVNKPRVMGGEGGVGVGVGSANVLHRGGRTRSAIT